MASFSFFFFFSEYFQNYLQNPFCVITRNIVRNIAILNKSFSNASKLGFFCKCHCRKVRHIFLGANFVVYSWVNSFLTGFMIIDQFSHLFSACCCFPSATIQHRKKIWCKNLSTTCFVVTKQKILLLVPNSLM